MLYILYNVYIIFLFSFELKTGSNGGGEIERNDSGVGSETSGTAQRLKRMRRLKSSHQTDGSSSTPTSLPSDDIPVAAPWCVDCDQPVEPDQEEYVPLVIIFITKCVSKKKHYLFLVRFCGSSCKTFDRCDSSVCHRCARRRCERREVLAELLETEVRYGRDLRVLQDELYKPLLVAGLVPLRQLGKKRKKRK